VRGSKLLKGQELLREEAAEMQQIVGVGRDRVGRIPTGAEMMQKMRYLNKRVVCIVEKFDADSSTGWDMPYAHWFPHFLKHTF
jgi:hypothetical protein